MTKEELTWNIYSKHVDMYPKYLELVLKLNVFYLGITGAIVSYVLANYSSTELLIHVLLLPVLMGILLGSFFAFGAITYLNVLRDMDKLRSKLQLEHWVRTDGFVFLSGGSAILCFTIAIGILVVYCKS